MELGGDSNNTCGNPVKRYSITCFSLFFIVFPYLNTSSSLWESLCFSTSAVIQTLWPVPGALFHQFTDPTGVATAKRHIETTAVGCDCWDTPWLTFNEKPWKTHIDDVFLENASGADDTVGYICYIWIHNDTYKYIYIYAYIRILHLDPGTAWNQPRFAVAQSLLRFRQSLPQPVIADVMS